MTGEGRVRIFDVAEGAVLVEYPGLPDGDANRKAVATARLLAARPPAGFLDAVPGARTLLVEFDPRRLSRARLAPAVQGDAGAAGEDPGRGRVLEIPVFYDPDPSIGPDLLELAEGAGLSIEEFARRHANRSYRVAFLGFAPGFAYLNGLAPELQAPRLSTPRTRVPAGSVGIAGGYTGIYPGATPGGWRLIGLAPVRLFDPMRDPPSLLLPGDAVRFLTLTREDFERRSSFLEAGRGEDMAPASGSPLFRVAAPGVFTSVQGAPLRGWAMYGVPPGGAMDFESLAVGNAALGNSRFDAALEMTFVGPHLEVLGDATVALAGAAFETTLNGRPAGTRAVFELRSGDVLKIGPLRRAARGYLCVSGGISHFGRPSAPRRLQAGDVVFVNSSADGDRVQGPAPGSLGAEDRETEIRVLPGPQQERFASAGLATFLGAAYRVSASSDRRGIRLEGPAIENRETADIPPEGTTLGGIQVPSAGQPIILGPDRPVTGGYARIATVAAADFPLVARALPGAALRFRQITLAEALAAMEGPGLGTRDSGLEDA